MWFLFNNNDWLKLCDDDSVLTGASPHIHTMSFFQGTHWSCAFAVIRIIAAQVMISHLPPLCLLCFCSSSLSSFHSSGFKLSSVMTFWKCTMVPTCSLLWLAHLTVPRSPSFCLAAVTSYTCFSPLTTVDQIVASRSSMKVRICCCSFYSPLNESYSINPFILDSEIYLHKRF